MRPGMRIVFRGENAASFSDGFTALLDAPADIAILPDALNGPADRAAYVGAGYDAVDLAVQPLTRARLTPLRP